MAKKIKKSLFELAHSPDDCGKLFESVYGFEWRPSVRFLTKNGIRDRFVIDGVNTDRYPAELTIYFDGRIEQSGMHGKVSVFYIVDKIRRLGYDSKI